MFDIISELETRSALDPQSVSGTVNGNAIDRQGFEGLGFSIHNAAAINAIPKLQEADDSGGPWTDVDATATGDQIGSFVTFDAVTGVQKVGYRGNKRYVRIVLTHTSGTADVSAQAILGRASRTAVENAALA